MSGTVDIFIDLASPSLRAAGCGDGPADGQLMSVPAVVGAGPKRARICKRLLIGLERMLHLRSNLGTFLFLFFEDVSFIEAHSKLSSAIGMFSGNGASFLIILQDYYLEL
jgi:hypothetical protein